MMKLQQLLQPWITHLPVDCTITGLHNDSRQIQPGFLFFAYPGAVSDGRCYIKQAIALGAAAIIYEPAHWPVDYPLPADCCSIALPQLAHHMAAIAARFYGQPSNNMTLTGVTGTNGKTTIAVQLAQAHQQLGQPAAYIGTLGHGQVGALQPLNNTTPDALCLQQLLHDYQQENIKQVCMEVSSHALAQQRVAHIDFRQAIFTNLTLDHLDYHHTMQDYALAKARLFAYPSLTAAIINNDDAYAGYMKAAVKPGCQVLTYGIKQDCDVRALDYQITLQGTSLCVQSPWGIHDVTIKALGFFNSYNALAIYTSLLLAGYPVQQVVAVMATLTPAPGRMDIVATKPYVIVDYAHTPDALDNVLQTLAAVKQARLLVVFGCGGDRDKSKRPLMGAIASRLADVVIVTSDNPRYEEPEQIIDEIMAGIIVKTTQLHRITDRKQAIGQALALAQPDDIVLIAGKGHETYQQIGNRRQFFSDKAMVQMIMTTY